MRKYHNRLFILIFIIAFANHANTEELGCDVAGPPQASKSPDALRGMAEHCQHLDDAALLSNRAYHQELLADYRSMLDLRTYSAAREDTKNYHAYRIFIGLSEAFARSKHQDPDGMSITWLNSIYERAGEIAELRIRGYDRQAERLERRLWER